MTIAEIKKLDANLKNFITTGKVFYIGEVKVRTNKSNGETFTTQSIGISDGNNKETDSIFVELSGQEEITDTVKGKTISCISCKINDWQGKRNLRASNFSFDIIPANDPVHPELPKTTVIPDEEPTIVTHVEQSETGEYKLSPREQSERIYWMAKDAKTSLHIARQHETSDAVALVTKFFTGNLEEAVNEVLRITEKLVDNVYGQRGQPKKTQAELLEDIKKNSAANVKNAEENLKDITISKNQQVKLFEIANENGFKEKDVKELISAYSYEHSADILVSNYDNIYNLLKKGKEDLTEPEMEMQR